MRYLITGICGFVGPHLANLLMKEGHEVCGLIRASNGRETDIRDTVPDENYSQMQFFYAELTNARSIDRIFSRHKFDGVFHLAAQSHPPTSFEDPEETFLINAMGTVAIVEAIAKYQPGCKLMNCSTSEVYGAVPESAGPIDENFPLAPINPYGVSKAAADLYVQERARSLDMPFYSTRAFSHTGPRRGHCFSISSDALQIARIEKGLQDPVIRVGTLSSKRVVMDVRDCVRAYYLLMQKFENGEPYNVGGDDLYSIGELLDMMLDIAGLKGGVELKTDPKLVRPIDIPIQIPDSTKCRKTIGWGVEIPMEKTLRDLLDYWRVKLSTKSTRTVQEC